MLFRGASCHAKKFICQKLNIYLISSQFHFHALLLKDTTNTQCISIDYIKITFTNKEIKDTDLKNI